MKTLILVPLILAELNRVSQLPGTCSLPPTASGPKAWTQPGLRVQTPPNTHLHLSPELLRLPLGLQPRPLCNQLLRDLFIGLVPGTFSHDPDPDVTICPQEPLDVLVACCLTAEGGTRKEEETGLSYNQSRRS